jgi:hypothetical protein
MECFSFWTSFTLNVDLPDSIIKSLLSSLGGTLGLYWETPSAMALEKDNHIKGDYS